MRVALGLTLLAVAASGAFAAVSTTPPPSRPSPYYEVVEGQHTTTADAGQRLTVMCPGGRHAMGAGYSAVISTPPTTAGGPAGQTEAGLDQVRSFPDSAGTGWQVQGISPDAVRLKLPWRLVVRVVCMQVPG